MGRRTCERSIRRRTARRSHEGRFASSPRRSGRSRLRVTHRSSRVSDSTGSARRTERMRQKLTSLRQAGPVVTDMSDGMVCALAGGGLVLSVLTLSVPICSMEGLLHRFVLLGRQQSSSHRPSYSPNRSRIRRSASSGSIVGDVSDSADQAQQISPAVAAGCGYGVVHGGSFPVEALGSRLPSATGRGPLGHEYPAAQRGPACRVTAGHAQRKSREKHRLPESRAVRRRPECRAEPAVGLHRGRGERRAGAADVGTSDRRPESNRAARPFHG